MKSLIISDNNTTDYFELLPDETLVNIFKWLPKSTLTNVALACKRFHRVTEDILLWRCFDGKYVTLRAETLDKLLSRQVMFLRLLVTKIPGPLFSSNCIASQPDFQSRLSYLDLTNLDTSLENMYNLFSKCKKLKKVSLANCTFNDKILIELSNNADLDEINLGWSFNDIGFEGIKAIISKCRKLKELNCMYSYLSTNALDFICANLTSTMRRLNLSGCRELRDQHIETLVTKCNYLTELDISDCSEITNKSIEFILEFGDLETLKLYGCLNVTLPFLKQLRFLQKLSHLIVQINATPKEWKQFEKIMGDRVTITTWWESAEVAMPYMQDFRPNTVPSAIWNVRVAN